MLYGCHNVIANACSVPDCRHGRCTWHLLWGKSIYSSESASLERTGITRARQALARLCYDTLRLRQTGQIEACKVRLQFTPALEAIIEANVYLSGVRSRQRKLCSGTFFPITALLLFGNHADRCCVALGTLVQPCLKVQQRKNSKKFGISVWVGAWSNTGKRHYSQERVESVSESTCVPGETIQSCWWCSASWTVWCNPWGGCNGKNCTG